LPVAEMESVVGNVPADPDAPHSHNQKDHARAVPGAGFRIMLSVRGVGHFNCGLAISDCGLGRLSIDPGPCSVVCYVIVCSSLRCQTVSFVFNN
jgi:hypothetical protein